MANGMWTDIACLVTACTLVNHLGLVDAVEGVIKFKLPVINCPKCLTFWSVLAYLLINRAPVIQSVALALVISYTALWLWLLMGYIDSIYTKVYGKIYKQSETK